MGMSLADLVSSMAYVVGKAAFPEDQGGRGTQATCQAQGFICNFQVCAALYSGCLAWYYCLYIRWQIKETDSTKYVEPLIHLVCLAFVLFTGSYLIAQDHIHPHWIRCYIRGPDANFYMWTLFFPPIWASMLAGATAMIIIYLYVRNLESRASKYRFQNKQLALQQSSSLNSSIPAESSHRMVSSSVSAKNSTRFGGESSLKSAASNPEHHEPKNNNTGRSSSSSIVTNSSSSLPKTRRVGYQAIGYTAVFILVYIFPTTSRTITTTQGSQSVPYAIRLLGEGFWNFWIFFGLPRLENSIKRRR